MVHDNIIDYVTTHVFLYIAQCYACFQEYLSSIRVPGKIYHEIAATFHSILVLGSFILLSKSINPLE